MSATTQREREHRTDTDSALPDLTRARTQLCPIQTFTEEAKLRNFPESDREPWVVVNTFGPTASGANGFTAIVPEMNSAC